MNRRTKIRDVATTPKDEHEHSDLVRVASKVEEDLRGLGKVLKGATRKFKKDCLERKQNVM